MDGRSISRNEDDQDQLLAWLHNRLVKYADKMMRYATRLDHGKDEEGEQAGNVLAQLLAAPLESDPEVRRLLVEESESLMQRARKSYSQATVYLLLLVRLHGDVAGLARHFRIGAATLLQRIRRLALLVRIQPSLFDGIECIDPEFQPLPGRTLKRAATSRPEVNQAGFWSLTA